MISLNSMWILGVLCDSVLGSEAVVLWQDRCQTGLGLGLGVASFILVLTFSSCFHHWCDSSLWLKCFLYMCVYFAFTDSSILVQGWQHVNSLMWRFLSSFSCRLIHCPLPHVTHAQSLFDIICSPKCLATNSLESTTCMMQVELFCPSGVQFVVYY